MAKRRVLEWSLSPTKLKYKQYGTKLTSKGQAKYTTATVTISKATTVFRRSKGRAYIIGRMLSIVVDLRRMRWRGTLRLNFHSLSTIRAKLRTGKDMGVALIDMPMGMSLRESGRMTRRFMVFIDSRMGLPSKADLNQTILVMEWWCTRMASLMRVSLETERDMARAVIGMVWRRCCLRAVGREISLLVLFDFHPLLISIIIIHFPSRL